MENIYQKLYKKSADLNVLYVEDDELVQTTTKEILEDFFNTVDIANNGLEGVQKYEEFKKEQNKYYDIVITDINMPKMNGVEMISTMKDINNSQEFIVTSAHNESDYLMKLIELNINSFVLKPIVGANFIEKLYVIVEKLYNEKCKEDYLIKQSKLAKMGDMVDMIAHQWLNQLSVLKMQLQSAEYEIEYCTDIKPYIAKCIQEQYEKHDFLQETLKEFRGFFDEISSKKPVSLNHTIENIVMLMNSSLIRNDINFTNESKEDITVDLFVNEFKHILINLIQNSTDAFNDNEISGGNRNISITCSIEDDHVLIDYKDNAGGIPKHILENIFEPRVSSKKYGSGMGTYLAKLIIDKHEGTMDVSNIENGANFKIRLKK